MSVSTQERISHVVRRLGIGARAALVDTLGSVDDAIAAALNSPVFRKSRLELIRFPCLMVARFAEQDLAAATAATFAFYT